MPLVEETERGCKGGAPRLALSFVYVFDRVQPKTNAHQAVQLGLMQSRRSEAVGGEEGPGHAGGMQEGIQWCEAAWTDVWLL